MAETIPRNPQSTETILTFDNIDNSQWSVEWSTSHIPGMDTGTGIGALGRRGTGRRRLRIGSLALGALLAMHCRITASALTGVVFVMVLVLAVVLLANPLRHFEVYLGQWSISGPGRAFRIVPILDGIGIAICINAIVRAINCCTIAAIAAVYVTHSVADAKLPFTYCRDFQLRAYEPVLKDLRSLMLKESRFSLQTGLLEKEDETTVTLPTSTVGLYHKAWRNVTQKRINIIRRRTTAHKIAVCKETYSGRYPPLFSTPAYNFFYVEVVQLRSDYSLGQFNLSLMTSIIFTWLVLWSFMIVERLLHGRLIWNNVRWWFLLVPCLWIMLLVFIGISNLIVMHKTLRKMFQIGAKEVIASIADALEVAMYIHSASVGTELIHGKGLNFYANGHVDPHLHGENVWHSSLVLFLTVVHTIGGALCAIVDCIQPLSEGENNMHESNLWIIPMYSKCTSIGTYSHLMSTLIFGGLMFSYMTVAFILLKTALHTIFEYRVKLVFIEQFVVSGLILSCMALSLVFVTSGGIALLESVDAIMSGVAMPLVCVMELTGILYVYRGHDFISDINLATEENTCSSRISLQWHIIPFLTVAALFIKISLLVNAEMPLISIYLGIAPLASVVIAVPIRACHNMYEFLRPTPRRGT